MWLQVANAGRELCKQAPRNASAMERPPKANQGLAAAKHFVQSHLFKVVMPLPLPLRFFFSLSLSLSLSLLSLSLSFSLSLCLISPLNPELQLCFSLPEEAAEGGEALCALRAASLGPFGSRTLFSSPLQAPRLFFSRTLGVCGAFRFFRVFWGLRELPGIVLLTR